MSKNNEMPEWLEKRLEKDLGYFHKEDVEAIDGYENGFQQCFEILWPKIKSMEYTLKMLEGYVDKDISELTLQETTNFEKALIQVRTTLKRLEQIK